MHCLVQPERRPSLASLSPLTLQAQTLRPKGAWQPEKLPNRLSGRRYRGAPRPGSPSSSAPQRHLPPTGGQARQPLPTVARIPSSLQRLAAGRPECRAVDDPGARAQELRESQWDAWRRPSSGAERELELGMGLQLEVGLEPEQGPE